MHIESTPVTHIHDLPVFKIHIQNSSGISVLITNFGATVMQLCTPDKKGKSENIITGFQTVEEYQQDQPYFGCVVGRYANRIGFGRFKLKEEEYQLATNNGPHHLHGGIEGFSKKVWKIKEIIHQKDSAGVELTYTSVDGEENYPGTLNVTVKYLLNENNEFSIEYTAQTDRSTVINLTNHCYYNLSAFHSPTITDHVLQIDAKKYLPVDDTTLPTGEKKNVKDTPFDFTSPKRIAKGIEEAGGYDHNFILSEIRSSEIKKVVTLHDPSSGRTMTVSTDQPGVQLYTANFLDGNLKGMHGAYGKYAALCLETQNWPDAPNQPSFPSAFLDPGENYHTKTIHQFSVL